LPHQRFHDHPITTAPLPGALDMRPNYRLAGAIWQDLPDTTFSSTRRSSMTATIGQLDAGCGHSVERIGQYLLHHGRRGPALEYRHGIVHAALRLVPQLLQLPRHAGDVGQWHPQVRSQLPMLMKPGKINVSHIFNEVVRLKLN